MDVAIRYAYREGYKKAKRDFVPPPLLTIHITPFNLLKLAGLNPHGPDRKHLDAALDRLKQPQIGQWPVFGILSYRHVGTTLVIELPTRWPDAAAVRFLYLPAPLPRSSPSALALLLFALPFAKPGGKPVDHAGLCKLLCIDPRLKRRRRIAMIDKAFVHANRWLASLDRAALQGVKLREKPVVPEALQLVEQQDGRHCIEWCEAAVQPSAEAFSGRRLRHQQPAWPRRQRRLP
jgi:hypothetical protein